MLIKNGTSQLLVDLKKGAAIQAFSLLDELILRKEDGGYYQSTLLFPFPNRLEKGEYEFEGQRYQFAQNDKELPNALHGMVHDKEFTVVKQEENSVLLKLKYEGDNNAYPFPFELLLSYTLEEASLKIEFEVINTGSGNMPCGFGWHPYFFTEQYEAAELKLPSINRVEIDEQMIPTGRRGPFNCFDRFEGVSKHDLDTCFKVRRQSESYSSFLKLANGNEVEVWQDDNFRYLQVFTPKEKTSVAIEPMTCNIDALNNGEGLRILAPKERWKMSFGVTLHQAASLATA